MLTTSNLIALRIQLHFHSQPSNQLPSHLFLFDLLGSNFSTKVCLKVNLALQFYPIQKVPKLLLQCQVKTYQNFTLVFFQLTFISYNLLCHLELLSLFQHRLKFVHKQILVETQGQILFILLVLNPFYLYIIKKVLRKLDKLFIFSDQH